MRSVQAPILDADAHAVPLYQKAQNCLLLVLQEQMSARQGAGRKNKMYIQGGQNMILIIIGCIAAAGAIGFVTATLFKVGSDHRGEPTHREPTKLLTVGCSVKYHGRVWEIRRFLVDSENQTIAEIESRDNGEHIIRRTMEPVEELEVFE